MGWVSSNFGGAIVLNDIVDYTELFLYYIQGYPHGWLEPSPNGPQHTLPPIRWHWMPGVPGPGTMLKIRDLAA